MFRGGACIFGRGGEVSTAAIEQDCMTSMPQYLSSEVRRSVFQLERLGFSV